MVMNFFTSGPSSNQNSEVLAPKGLKWWNKKGWCAYRYFAGFPAKIKKNTYSMFTYKDRQGDNFLTANLSSLGKSKTDSPIWA